MQLNTHFVGEITERQVTIEFLKRGIMLSKPIVQSSRYDFIADIDNKFFRLQIKTSQETKDHSGFSFSTRTSHTNSRGTKNIAYSKDDVDFFVTIHDETCYVIPFGICGHKCVQTLRIAPTKNNQKKNVMYAKDFTIDVFLENIRGQKE